MPREEKRKAGRKHLAVKEKGKTDVACEAKDKTCQDEIEIRSRGLGLIESRYDEEPRQKGFRKEDPLEAFLFFGKKKSTKKNRSYRRKDDGVHCFFSLIELAVQTS
jgi:hypothetical protein